MKMNPHRANIISILQLIERECEQDKYQKDVPFVSVVTEMCCQWFDDFYHPNANEFTVEFSKQELSAFKEFNNIFELYVHSLPDTLEDLHKHKGWLKVSDSASKIVNRFGWQDIEPEYDL